MKLPRGRRFRPLPMRNLVPNSVTVLALCAGLTAIRFALQSRWEMAVAAIIVAGILDGLDGRLARLLKGTSRFGAELDSLSDFVSFGVAPGVVLYTWSLREAGGLGWIAVLVFGVSCALRLARFNTAMDDPDRPSYMSNYFTGVPAPAGAGLALLPMMLSFQDLEEMFRLPAVIAPYLIGVAILMVSRLPTYSMKRVRVPRDHILFVLMAVGLFAALMISYPWTVLTAVGAIYLLSIPLSVRSCARLAAAQAVGQPAEARPPGGADAAGDDAAGADPDGEEG